uniref:TFA2 Winged helix domain-containing protein n=1 Tax=Prolemur simus TaxID=1328070 RepID=A0A8C9DEG8_PROSS
MRTAPTDGETRSEDSGPLDSLEEDCCSRGPPASLLFQEQEINFYPGSPRPQSPPPRPPPAPAPAARLRAGPPRACTGGRGAGDKQEAGGRAGVGGWQNLARGGGGVAGRAGPPSWLSVVGPSLLRERVLLKKRALSSPVREKCAVSSQSSSSPSSSKKKEATVEHRGSSGAKQNSDQNNGSFNLKALSGGSGYKFGVLAEIVNYRKTHQPGDTYPPTLEEILDETQHLAIGLNQKQWQQWLMTETLVNNLKIEPKYNLKDKKALLRLLDKHDQRALGGILLENIEEGLPNCQKAVKALGDQILFVNRPDKKKIQGFCSLAPASVLLTTMFCHTHPEKGASWRKPEGQKRQPRDKLEEDSSQGRRAYIKEPKKKFSLLNFRRLGWGRIVQDEVRKIVRV